VSLRRRFVLYLLVLHLVFAGLAVALFRRHRLWVLAVEVAFVVSLAWGLGLVRQLFGALSLLQSGAQLLKESDFQSRLRETGRPETDQLIGVYNKMAEHLREERTRLQEQQYLLATILHESPSGVAILDFDGRITFANARAGLLLGAPPEGLPGRRLADIASPLGPALLEMDPGQSRVVPLTGARRVKCHVGSFVDRGFARRFVLLEELTDELRAHERAAYEKVIRMLSHEVNNSMGATSSLLQSCLHYAPQLRPEDRADFEAALRVSLARTEQLCVFMRGFADVVRLPPPRLQPHDVRALLEGIGVLLKPDSERRRVAWRWDLPAGVDPVPMDRAQIEQVLVNVCKNALEAIGEDGTLTVRLGRRASRTFAEIEDSGPGIPDDVRPHLFTPFFTTKENGQGIGLTMVREILSQHRFDYSLDSPPGGPTRFTILF
jgi:two-component system, NtrC family, nitrogen regulation sensor histidine kinase NtrY